MKYLEDKRRRLQGQQTEVVQKQPIQYTPKTAPAVQTQAAAPAPAQKQTYTAPKAPAEKQSTTPAPTSTTTAPVQTAGADVVAQAQEYLNQQLGGYKSQYGSQITDLVAQLQNRPAFEYDVNTDPLYLQLRDIWKQDGLMAMEDTMGQAAQLTGGYGNSHAQMAGQQVYNNHLREVAEMVPQLKEAARADYDADTDVLLRNLGLLMEQDSTDYARWMDELERQRYAEQQEYDRGRDALADQRYDREWEYQQGRDQLADQRYEDELAYGREQDQYQRQQQSYDRLLELIIATGYKPTAEELAAAGMTEAEAKAWLGYYTANQAVGGGGSSGGGSRGSGGGSRGSGGGSRGSGGGSRGSGGGSRGSGGGTGSYADSNTSAEGGQGAGVPSPLEMGDPLRKEDYTHVYANCAVYAGNGAPASELAAYIKQALKDGSINQDQYNELMRKFGSLADGGDSSAAGSSDQGTRSTGGGSFGDTAKKPVKPKKPWEVGVWN